MNKMRENNGFTLVELLVTIAVGSLITLAAVSILLLGLRVNAGSTGTVIRQNTARIVLTTLENLASEGTITKVESGPDHWIVYGADEKVLLSYSDSENAIYIADSTEPILDEVIASFVHWNGTNKVLTFSVETESGSYSSAVYCRTAVEAPKVTNAGDTVISELNNPEGEDPNLGTIPNAEARKAFLKALASQYTLAGGAPNPGLILNNGLSTGRYYSQWYIGKDDAFGWDGETPWCACFVSWGLYQVRDKVTAPGEASNQPNANEGHWFASVDYFMNYLKSNNAEGNEWVPAKDQPKEKIYPGDIIFIDWTGGDDPAHVGVVLTSDATHVYTLEGNSAGMVAVRKYKIDDPIILAYGVLNWAQDTVTE